MNQPTDRTLQELQDVLRNELEANHGPLITGNALVSALGLRSGAALRQARRRGQIAVPLFTVPHRRGLFALSRDIADWLARVRLSAEVGNEGKEEIRRHQLN